MSTHSARKTWTPDGRPQKRVLSLPVERILPRCGLAAPFAEREADVAAQRSALRLAARQSAAACSAMTLKWLGGHYVAGTAAQLVAGAQQAQFSDAQLNLEIYHAARAAAPKLLPLNCGATFQWWAATLKNQTSPRDNVKRWRQVLRGAEAAPHYGDEQPIRVAPTAATLHVAGDCLVVECKLIAGAPPVRLELKSPAAAAGGRNGRQYADRWLEVAALSRLNGLQLVRAAGRWEVRPVVIRSARLPLAEPGKTLLLRASARAAMVARLDGRSALLFGDQIRLVEAARLELIAVRAEERAAGRTGARNRRREAATAKWSNVCATLSRQICSYVAQWCEQNGVRRIVFKAGDDACLLSSCGLSEEELSREPTRFPYRQFAEFLQQKCQLLGIEVVYTPNLRSVKRRKALRARRLARERVQGAAV